MEYTVRQAGMGDLPRILEIYAYARRFMAANGNPTQWGDNWPEETLLRQDIQDGELWAVTRGETIHGVFYFSVKEDPTYRVIHDGVWRSDGPYGVIHRVASDGSGGIFSACLSHCQSKAGHLRIDTHQDNRIMQRVLEKHGFQRCGIIYVGDGTPRIAYERV